MFLYIFEQNRPILLFDTLDIEIFNGIQSMHQIRHIEHFIFNLKKIINPRPTQRFVQE